VILLLICNWVLDAAPQNYQIRAVSDGVLALSRSAGLTMSSRGEKEMNMTKKAVAGCIVAIGLVLAGCEGNQMGQKQTVGTLGGAALGGLLGSQVGGGTGKLVATGLGVFVGGLLGSEVGKSLDKADRLAANQAYGKAQAAPVGETVNWSNPQSGHSGSYTPVREGTSTSGRYCREFQQTITVGGKTEQGYGTACRQPDGSWQIVQG
jgi:surface antigen